MNAESVVTHPDKVFWPEEGYTKLDLARYYVDVFPKLQSWVQDRPLALERCPDGMGGECFFQKEAPESMPAGTPTKLIHHQNRPVHYVVGGLIETQIALVNLGCIAVHAWSSRASRPHQPDWVVFDVDPGSGEFADAARAGLLVKEVLDALDLVSFPKTSGGRGMHVFVPIQTGPGFDETRAFAEEIGRRLAGAHPDILTVEQRLMFRGDRVYLDPLRNAFGATVVAPYSVRRREKAPVSMPLRWQDVRTSLNPSHFNLGNAAKHIAGADPWLDFFDRRQSLGKAMKALQRV
ncbi:MAG: non-homologous end-joining DNA ligase [Bryobacteraceae bacterium]|jgi:bifunctional non-homologous end joining protein LigD